MDNHHPTKHADRLLQAAHKPAERTLRDVSRSFLGVYGDGGALRLPRAPKVASNLPKPPKARSARKPPKKPRTRTSSIIATGTSWCPRLPGMRFPHWLRGLLPRGWEHTLKVTDERKQYDERTDETRPPAAHAHATPRMPIRLDTDEETLANSMQRLNVRMARFLGVEEGTREAFDLPIPSVAARCTMRVGRALCKSFLKISPATLKELQKGFSAKYKDYFAKDDKDESAKRIATLGISAKVEAVDSWPPYGLLLMRAPSGEWGPTVVLKNKTLFFLPMPRCDSKKGTAPMDVLKSFFWSPQSGTNVGKGGKPKARTSGSAWVLPIDEALRDAIFDPHAAPDNALADYVGQRLRDGWLRSRWVHERMTPDDRDASRLALEEFVGDGGLSQAACTVFGAVVGGDVDELGAAGLGMEVTMSEDALRETRGDVLATRLVYCRTLKALFLIRRTRPTSALVLAVCRHTLMRLESTPAVNSSFVVTLTVEGTRVRFMVRSRIWYGHALSKPKASLAVGVQREGEWLFVQHKKKDTTNNGETVVDAGRFSMNLRPNKFAQMRPPKVGANYTMWSMPKSDQKHVVKLAVGVTCAHVDADKGEATFALAEGTTRTDELDDMMSNAEKASFLIDRPCLVDSDPLSEELFACTMMCQAVDAVRDVGRDGAESTNETPRVDDAHRIADALWRFLYHGRIDGPKKKTDASNAEALVHELQRGVSPADLERWLRERLDDADGYTLGTDRAETVGGVVDSFLGASWTVLERCAHRMDDGKPDAPSVFDGVTLQRHADRAANRVVTHVPAIFVGLASRCEAPTCESPSKAQRRERDGSPRRSSPSVVASPFFQTIPQQEQQVQQVQQQQEQQRPPQRLNFEEMAENVERHTRRFDGTPVDQLSTGYFSGMDDTESDASEDESNDSFTYVPNGFFDEVIDSADDLGPEYTDMIEGLGLGLGDGAPIFDLATT